MRGMSCVDDGPACGSRYCVMHIDVRMNVFSKGQSMCIFGKGVKIHIVLCKGNDSHSTEVSVTWVDFLIVMIANSEEVANQDSFILIFRPDIFAIGDVAIFLKHSKSA